MPAMEKSRSRVQNVLECSKEESRSFSVSYWSETKIGGNFQIESGNRRHFRDRNEEIRRKIQKQKAFSR